MAKKKNPVLAALEKAATGLRYTSETDAPLEAFAWDDGAALTTKHLLELAGAESGEKVETVTLENFLHAVPPEDKAKFDALAKALQSLLTGIKVFKVGKEAEKEAYVVGKTTDGHWAGLKTTVVET